jgi:hypothetical protein
MSGTTKIVLPYYDEGKRHYSLLIMNGTMYASKMYAIIKEFVLDNFGVRVDKDWLIHVPVIHNSNDAPYEDKSIDDRVNAWLDRIEDKADEDKKI